MRQCYATSCFGNPLLKYFLQAFRAAIRKSFFPDCQPAPLFFLPVARLFGVPFHMEQAPFCACTAGLWFENPKGL